MTPIDPAARELLTILGGDAGGWCNLWGSPRLSPIWYPAGHPPKNLPEYWPAVYFSLAPRVTRLTGKRRGTMAEVNSLTCLYSEIDEKDGKAWADVERLQPKPSAIVRSGGGWHVYWFIHPVLVTDDNRDELNRLQHRWTEHTGGDIGAADIARVLRVPGTYNLKYTPARKVELIEFYPRLRYDLEALRDYLPPEEKPHGGAGKLYHCDKASKCQNDTLKPDPDYWLNKALAMAAPGNRNRVGFWLACQLRDAGLPEGESLSLLERYQRRVDTPRDRFTRHEAEACARSAYKGATREPARAA